MNLKIDLKIHLKIDQKIYESGGVVGLNYASNDQTVAMHNTYSNWPSDTRNQSCRTSYPYLPQPSD